MSKKVDFALCCLEAYKVHTKQNGRQVFSLFEQYGVFAYLEKHYSVLHTLGEQYLMEDIDAFLAKRKNSA